MTSLRLHPAAAEELAAAARLIDEARPRWGALFFAEVRGRIERAARFPHSGALVPEAPAADRRRRRPSAMRATVGAARQIAERRLLLRGALPRAPRRTEQ